MQLTQERKKALKAIGHKLNPVVTVAGNGLTENVILEIDRALEDHELIVSVTSAYSTARLKSPSFASPIYCEIDR